MSDACPDVGHYKVNSLIKLIPFVPYYIYTLNDFVMARTMLPLS